MPYEQIKAHQGAPITVTAENMQLSGFLGNIDQLPVHP